MSEQRNRSTCCYQKVHGIRGRYANQKDSNEGNKNAKGLYPGNKIILVSIQKGKLNDYY